MELRYAPLFSGSSGNSIFVSYGNTNILVDAGFSRKLIVEELKKLGIDPDCLSAVLCSHEHIDHCNAVGILARQYALPIYCTSGTWNKMPKQIGKIADNLRCVVVPGQDFYIGDINVSPFSIPHDSAEPVGYSFYCGGARFTIATDIGCLKPSWMDYVIGSDSVLLESNYDPGMLEASSYPYNLKKRISSNRGHLCNEDAAGFCVDLVKSGTKHIILGHLSENNNFPELALKCTEQALWENGIVPGEDVRIDVAKRYESTGLFAISAMDS